MKEKLRKKYCRQVRQLLPCSGRVKRSIAAQLENRLANYLAENPDADYEQIKLHFGAPETVAASYIESTGTAEILKSLRIRKRIVRIIVMVAVFMLVTWSALITWELIRANETLGGHMEVFLTEGEVEIDPNEISDISVAP